MGPSVADTSCHLPSGPGWEGCSSGPNLFLHWPSWPPVRGGQDPAFLLSSSSAPRFCQWPEPLPCGVRPLEGSRCSAETGPKGERGGESNKYSNYCWCKKLPALEGWETPDSGTVLLPRGLAGPLSGSQFPRCEVSVLAESADPRSRGGTVRTRVQGSGLTPFLRCYPGSQQGWAFAGCPT